jgi:hypothetical protein
MTIFQSGGGGAALPTGKKCKYLKRCWALRKVIKNEGNTRERYSDMGHANQLLM